MLLSMTPLGAVGSEGESHLVLAMLVASELRCQSENRPKLIDHRSTSEERLVVSIPFRDSAFVRSSLILCSVGPCASDASNVPPLAPDTTTGFL